MAVKAGEVEVDVVVRNEAARGLAEVVAEAEAAVRQIGSLEGDAKADLDIKDLVAKAAEAEAIIKALDGQDVEVDVDINDKGEIQRVTKDLAQLTDATVENAETVAKLRARYAELFTARKRANDVDFGRKSAREKLEMDRLDTALLAVGHRIRSLGGSTRDLNIDLDKNRGFVQRARSALSTLGKTRINLGPFSTSIKGLGVILGTLGPIIVNMVGSLGALVGVAGTGLAGAFAVGSGAISGFGLAVIGLLPSLKALFAEAKTAPEIVGPLQKMRDSLTGGIRQPFFQAAHAAIQTLQADFPVFQRGAEGAFKAASTGFQTWMRGLRSSEAQSIIGDLLGNLTKSLPSLMDGLGHIGTALGRIAQSGSRFLPSLNQGFEQWALNLENSIGSGNALDQSVGRLVGHMRDIGHFAQASGSLLTTFFNAGADSGDNLLRTFTATERRWTAWMRTVGGQRSLRDFFSGAVENTKQLFSALAPLLSTFIKLSDAFTPLSTGALKFATALGDVVQAITSFGLGSIGLKAIGATLAAIWTVSKVTAFSSAIRGAAVSLGLLTAAEEGAALAGAGSAAAVAEGQLALAGTEGAAVGASTALLGVGAAFALPVAAAVGLTLILGKTDTAFEVYQRRLAASATAAQQTANAQRNLTQSLKTANDLADQGKQRTEAYRTAVTHARTAEAQRTVAVQNQQKAQDDLRSSLDSYQHAQELVNTTTKNGVPLLRGGATSYALASNELRQLSDAADQFHLSQINMTRTLQGQQPLLQSQARLFGILRAQFGKGLTAKIGVSGTPGQAATIGRLASQLRSFASTKAVAKILVSDEGAKAKIQDLQNLLDKTDKPHHTKLTVSADKGKIESYLSAAAKADKSHTTNIRANTSAATGAIQSVIGFLASIPRSITSVINVVKHIAGGAEGGAFAEGGMADMDRVYREASNRRALEGSSGARVTRPTYITGEENRPEFVIATNPAYRRSNLLYLGAAAAALGQAIIPGYKKGGGPAAKAAKKKKPKGAPAGIGESLDDATDPASPYQIAEDLVTYDSGIADLVRRQYDLNLGPGIGDVVRALSTEVADYQSLSGLIGSLLAGRPGRKVDVPPVSKVNKKAKGAAKKRQEQAQKKSQAAHDAAQAHNDAIHSGAQDLSSEKRTIDAITIPGLLLDILEAQNAAASNTILGQETANLTRYNLYKQFAGNLLGGPGNVPAAGTGPSQSFGALGSFSAASPSGSFAAASSPSIATPSGSASAGGITINQTFPTPPADAHVWAQNTVFEIAAAGA